MDFVEIFGWTSRICNVLEGEVVESVGMFEPFVVLFLDDWIMEVPEES